MKSIVSLALSSFSVISCPTLLFLLPRPYPVLGSSKDKVGGNGQNPRRFRCIVSGACALPNMDPYSPDDSVGTDVLSTGPISMWDMVLGSVIVKGEC